MFGLGSLLFIDFSGIGKEFLDYLTCLSNFVDYLCALGIITLLFLSSTKNTVFKEEMMNYAYMNVSVLVVACSFVPVDGLLSWFLDESKISDVSP